MNALTPAEREDSVLITQAAARWLGLTLLALGVGVACGGCGRSGPETVLVSGTVLLDGKPMPDGDVAFDGLDGSPPVHAAVADGRFSLRVVPGEKRVLVNRYKATGEKNYLGEIPLQSILPDRYNVRSELRAIITKQGHHDLELQVTSQ